MSSGIDLIQQEAMNVLEKRVVNLIPHIVDATPRDIALYPIKNSNRKDGKRPERNVRKGNRHYYRRIVKEADGNYYEGVTGNLKNSITYARKKNGFRVIVGEKYGIFQELGTRNMGGKFFVKNTILKQLLYGKG